MPNDSVHLQSDLAMSLLTAHIQQHSGAADTFDGIARWWLGLEPEAISPSALRLALQRLVEGDVLRTRRLHSGETLWYSPHSPAVCGGCE